MTDSTAIAAQLALIIERLDSLTAETKALREDSVSQKDTLDKLVAAQEKEPASPGKQQAKSDSIHGPAVKFTTEDLSEVEFFSGTKKNRGVSSHAAKPGGAWQNQFQGQEQIHRHTDGGGDWQVKPIGVESPQGYSQSDFRAQEKRQWTAKDDACDDGDIENVKRIVPAIKMEFPSYDGTTNAIEWLQKCEDYFEDQRVFSDEARVRQATFVLTGRAYHWYHNLRRLVTQKLSWFEFKKICKSRFGKADSVNPVGELSNLRHTGTVDDYCSQFEECLGRQTKLTGDQQLWQFCAGLTDSLRKEVEYLRPETIFKAMEYARDHEYKIDNDRRTRTFGGHLAPTTRSMMAMNNGNDTETVMPQQEAKKAPPRKYLKKLTVEEMAERKAKGLCFNCDELFTRDHVCNPMLFQIMPVRDGDNQEDEPFDEENWKDE
ncbi:unnamed protein product [Microthlaspi erraticum]|uniref:Ty3 transposon capsid-like protein domain-containing protein n=1 Tax=Microthlaspi erraticum TaxID=1685480 RepID=A0A6D2JNE6_9BRAS|nr:unnamed protein product [Microthlaspi erraticum]